MIPKVIHYCWFGKNPKPKSVEKCIKSWKKYCPDYQIIEWNENTFDVNSNSYVKEAYASKKWAFVTDYVRLWAIYNMGGIYMDTDVELVGKLDKYLMHDAFSGFESPKHVPTGLMAGEKENLVYLELLRYYDDRHFVLEDGSFDMTTNTKTITDYMIAKGLKGDNSFQVINGFAFYPNDYFCPKSHYDGIIRKTKNTVAIHHFDSSWFSEERQKEKIRRWKSVKRKHWRYAPNRLLLKVAGEKHYNMLKMLIKHDG